MLVTKTGRAWGTIGGGQLEYSCEARARELLAAGRCAVERFELRPQGAGDLGMVCGGDVTVWFQYLPGAVLEQSPEGPLLWLLLEQDKTGQGKARLCAARELEGGRRICGGGRFTDTPRAATGIWNVWPRRIRCISSARGMWPRRWHPAWRGWAFPAMCWTTGRSMPGGGLPHRGRGAAGGSGTPEEVCARITPTIRLRHDPRPPARP